MTRLPAPFTTAAAVLTLALAAGCGQNTVTKPNLTSGTTTSSADQAAIQQLIDTMPEFDATFSDDNGDISGTAAASASPANATTAASATDTLGATLPVHWGRLRRPADQPPTRTIEFLTPPESLRALVRINVKFNGWLFVDRTDDGIRNPGKKPLRDQLTRYALFKKIWFHPDSTSTDSIYGWRLLGISPTQYTMIDPAAQTVNVTSVTFTGAHSHVTITDPSALLSLRRTDPPLPLFQAGEQVKVEAAVTNTDAGYDPPTYVFLHVPTTDRLCPLPSEQVRILMHDDGLNGDAVAGDGTFTAMWTVRDWGRHYAAVDVINSRTLQNETDDDYNSTTWAVPYASYPSFLP